MPAEFPTSIYAPRTKANQTGVVYDPLKTTIGYAEDVKKLDDEVVAIETYLKAPPVMYSVPTSPVGLPAGSVWCDTTDGLNILKLI